MSDESGHKKRPSWSSEISLGNILSIAAMLSAVYLFVGDLKKDIAVLQTQSSILKQEVDNLRARFNLFVWNQRSENDT